MEEKKQGRPKKDPARHKRNRGISLTDDEYKALQDKAAQANCGVSEYIILKLGLATPPIV